MFQILTVRDGQRVAVWDLRGRVEYVDGPRRLYLFMRNVEHLRRHSAEAHQYLAIRYRDGRREHVRGPAAVWHDPVEHEQIEVQEALAIDAHEAVVVYRRDSGEVPLAWSRPQRSAAQDPQGASVHAPADHPRSDVLRRRGRADPR